MCQFLLGTVQQNSGTLMHYALSSNLLKCQFLLGTVQLMNKLEIVMQNVMCQFLLGTVQPGRTNLRVQWRKGLLGVNSS